MVEIFNRIKYESKAQVQGSRLLSEETKVESSLTELLDDIMHILKKTDRGNIFDNLHIYSVEIFPQRQIELDLIFRHGITGDISGLEAGYIYHWVLYGHHVDVIRKLLQAILQSATHVKIALRRSADEPTCHKEITILTPAA